ncbi:MAG: hypothetical protein VKJ05_08335 [Synechococcaceae cyanobacterium]|nr:hypothetical protein [Synechococcaceae cyanobacterium]
MHLRPTLLAGMAALLVGPLASAGLAQRPLNEIRALNFARNTGVMINGGLRVYRPQACMFTTSAETNPCLIRSDETGFVYRFLGGPPGWQAEGQQPTMETEIQVSPEGNELVRVLYNGPPRPPLPR